MGNSRLCCPFEVDAYMEKLSWWLDSGLMLVLDPWLWPDTARLQANVCCAVQLCMELAKAYGQWVC